MVRFGLILEHPSCLFFIPVDECIGIRILAGSPVFEYVIDRLGLLVVLIGIDGHVKQRGSLENRCQMLKAPCHLHQAGGTLGILGGLLCIVGFRRRIRAMIGDGLIDGLLLGSLCGPLTDFFGYPHQILAIPNDRLPVVFKVNHIITCLSRRNLINLVPDVVGEVNVADAGLASVDVDGVAVFRQDHLTAFRHVGHRQSLTGAIDMLVVARRNVVVLVIVGIFAVGLKLVGRLLFQHLLHHGVDLVIRECLELFLKGPELLNVLRQHHLLTEFDEGCSIFI